MSPFVTQKDQIIAQMRAELSKTKVTDRYYTEQNITDCNAHLEAFLAQLEKADQAPDKQAYLVATIQTLCEQLSTFNDPEEEEMPEFLWGFLYNGYTVEISNFIRETALAYGLEVPAAKVIALHNCTLEVGEYNCFTVTLGAEEKDEPTFVSLEYDPHAHQFFLDENPYGDPYLVPIYNLQINTDETQLSFEVLLEGRYQHFQLIAQYPQDKLWLKTLYNLHTQRVLLGEYKKPWSRIITLHIEEGQLKELRPIQYDESGEVIDIFQENGGFDVFPMGINENGELQGKYVIADTKIIEEKVFFADHRTEWQLYELGAISMQKGKITLTSTDKRYTRDKEGKLLIKAISPISLSYELKNSEFVLNFVQEILNKQEKSI